MTYEDIKEEIAHLERRLKELKATRDPSEERFGESSHVAQAPPVGGSEVLHTLLLLSDSALPLGSFAFSNGLESYLAHRRLNLPGSRSGGISGSSTDDAFAHFLHLSLTSVSSTALPFLLAAYSQPRSLQDLDNDFDAQTPCPVGRRASVAQGRALLTVWERSLAARTTSAASGLGPTDLEAIEALATFAKLMRSASSMATASSPGPCSSCLDTVAGPNAHLPPLWGVLTRALGLPAFTAVYGFLFAHARATASAAVRAGAMGSYSSQALLSGSWLRGVIVELVNESLSRERPNDGGDGLLDVGQTVPILDMWVGRHEILYTRIFNS